MRLPHAVLLLACLSLTGAAPRASVEAPHATVVAPAASAPGDDRHDAFASMAEAERAFAKLSAGKGMRAAFIEYLEDDAIQFQPTFGRAKDTWKARPVPANPLATVLVWDPRVGDVSADGLLGWLSGPYFIVPDGDASKTAYGCYFSVWRRAANGPWRVYIDLGIDTPGPCEAPATLEAPPERGASSRGTREALVAADAAVAATSSLAQGLAGAADPLLRVHLDGRQPLAGRDAALDALKSDATAWTFTPRDGFVSGSGDLGITYGDATPAGATKTSTYLRVWRPDARAHWTVVFQTIAG